MGIGHAVSQLFHGVPPRGARTPPPALSVPRPAPPHPPGLHVTQGSRWVGFYRYNYVGYTLHMLYTDVPLMYVTTRLPSL